MPFETWSVAATISATSNVASVMSSATKATLIANSAINQQNVALRTNAARAAALRQQIAKTQAVQHVATAGFTTLAAVSGAAIYEGVKGAADLQAAMTNVAIATGRATNNMSDFYQLAFKMSGQTAQSVTTIASEMAVAASGGLGDPKQLKRLFPTIAKAADVMWLSPKHLEPVDTVRTLSTFAHVMGAYKGLNMEHMLNRATQLMFVQPEALQAVITQGRRFIGPALHRGVSEDDIFKQTLAMGQTGFLRGHGGAGLANILNYLSGAESVTSHQSKVRRQAFGQLGVWDSKGHLKFQDEKGHLLLGQAIKYLHDIQGRFSPMAFATILTNAFGKQGSSYLTTILRPAVYDQIDKNWQRMQSIGNVNQLWTKYTQTFWYQWSVFITNFSNITKTIFLPLLPQLTSMFKTAGERLGDMVMWLSHHATISKRIAEGAFVAFGIGVAGIGATSVVATLSIWRLNAALAALNIGSNAAAGGSFLGIFGRIGGFFAGIAGAGGGVIARFFSPITRLVTLLAGRIVPIVAGGLSRLVPVVGWAIAIAGAVGLLVGAITRLPNLITTIHNWWVRSRVAIGYTIGYVFAEIGSMIMSGLTGLVSSAQAAVSTAAQNIYLLATPGGNAELQTRIALAMAEQQKNWSKARTPGFMDALKTGVYDQTHGIHSTPHGYVTIQHQSVIVNMPKGTPKEHADSFLEHVLNHAHSVAGRSPSFGTLPSVSRHAFGH